MTLERLVLAVLARLLPPHFRDRQRAEWAADLAELASRRPGPQGDGSGLRGDGSGLRGDGSGLRGDGSGAGDGGAGVRGDQARGTAAGARARWRYLLAAAWTLPELRATVRDGAPSRFSVHGLRAGLGRPGTPGIVVLAVLVSVLAGLFGAAGASRAGWELARSLPVGAEAEAIKQAVFPGAAFNAAPLEGPAGDQIEFGGTGYAAVDSGAVSVSGLMPGVRDRLAAAGWRIVEHPDGPAGAWGGSGEVHAVRDGLKLYYDGGITFTVGRSVPAWMVWFVVAGGALGALAGWLVTGWAGRRSAEGSAAAQLAGMLAWPTVVVMLFLLLGRLLLRPGGQSWPDMFYAHLLYISGGPPLWVSVVAGAALATVGVLGRSAPGGRSRVRG